MSFRKPFINSLYSYRSATIGSTFVARRALESIANEHRPKVRATRI
jgi:hypothetical protein